MVDVPKTAEVRSQIIALLPRLRRFARGLTGSVDRADDLVQGACEKALAALASYEPGTRLDSWMFRIIRNLWIDQIRRDRHAPEHTAPDVAGEDGRRTVEMRMDLADMRGLIFDLPTDQREVLVLVCVEELSYRETAAVLDIPIGTVMSRLARARSALAAGLNGEAQVLRPKFRGSG